MQKQKYEPELELPLPEDNGGGYAGEDNILLPLTKEELLTIPDYGREEARAVVDLYYAIQKARVGASNRSSAHKRRVDNVAGDCLVVNHLKAELEKIERQAQRAMRYYANQQELGKWAMSINGVSYIFASSLLAHIDIKKAPTAGAIWRFAGIDPSIDWGKGKTRPYNAKLKTMCFLIGQAFKMQAPNSKPEEELTEKQLAFRAQKATKMMENENRLYTKLYVQRKEMLVQKNEAGGFKEYALARLAKARLQSWEISPEQRELWASGKIQDRGLDLMACEYAVMIFLSHYHHVGYNLILGKDPPVPYIMAHGGGQHVHYIPPPNWPWPKEEAKKQRKKAQ